MEQVLTSLLRAFRVAGGRVSPAESIDAAQTVLTLGYADRAQLKQGLGIVVAKSVDDKVLFDSVFEQFFAQQATQNSVSPESDLNNEHEFSDQAEVLAAAQAAGVDDIRFESQKAYYVRQMTREMGVEGLERELLEQMDAANQGQVQNLMAQRRAMEQRARKVVDQKYELFGKPAGKAFLEDIAASKAIQRITPQEQAQMNSLVARMAHRLADKHARRRKKNRGQLNFRKSLRQSLASDGVPFVLHWKQKQLDRPRLVVLCDVSSSVSNHVRFLLMFLHAMADKVADFRAFAFSHETGEVTDALHRQSFEVAMAGILRTWGSGGTDYGQALHYLSLNEDSLDRHTTLLILGDGRSNGTNPKIELLAQIADRVKRVVWLCPEPEGRWGSGDSCMLEYRPLCTQVTHCATALDLERAIDEALLAYQ